MWIRWIRIRIRIRIRNIGAAIAAGNQAEKGNSALFLEAAKFNTTISLLVERKFLKLKYK
jgi:hypothetical protein